MSSLKTPQQQQLYTLAAIGKRLLPFARPYFGKYVVGLALLIVTALLTLLPPFLLKLMIDSGIHGKNFAALNLFAAASILVIILASFSRGIMEYLLEWLSAHFIADVRETLFEHVLRQSMEFFGASKAGDIVSRLRVDITAVYGVLVNTFLGAISEISQIVGISIFLLYLNWRLGLVALSFVPVLIVVLRRSGRRLHSLSVTVRDKDAGLQEFFQERMNYVSTVKLFHREAFEKRGHRSISEEVIRVILARVKYKFRSLFFVAGLTSIAGILVMWYGGALVITAGMTFGALFAFYVYTTRLYSPVQSLVNRSIDIYNGVASVQRILEYLDLRPAIAEPRVPIALRAPRGAIEFDSIDFTYPNASEPVFRQLSLVIEPGETVAFVGSSGAGKTTLAHLLCRLYDVDSGAIRIDGIDIRDLSFEDLYSAVGIVPQDTAMFNASVEDNIRYGRPDASPEEVVSAATAAEIHSFLSRLPAGYRTIVGPRGMKLSGGQRQRLALARMLLKDAAIWILDEFTSSLDSQSEALVFENLDPLLRDKTAIVIAHRLSTIVAADRVVVLQDGRIAEIGTHRELYGKGGLYRRFFDRQSPVMHDSLLTRVG
ncbi:MAG: ABC transporter ATP-binding protein [Acidobacteriaceae bacterium]|nr:ABC transporter ATP-binding protein [Acidobacteriaceae bacterium]